MSRLRATGFNSLREELIWNGTSVPLAYDLAAVCNTAREAENAHLRTLMLHILTPNNDWPTDKASLQAFDDSIEAYDYKLFNRDDGQEHCLSRDTPVQVQWMIGNEPNISTF